MCSQKAGHFQSQWITKYLQEVGVAAVIHWGLIPTAYSCCLLSVCWHPFRYFNVQQCVFSFIYHTCIVTQTVKRLRQRISWPKRLDLDDRNTLMLHVLEPLGCWKCVSTSHSVILPRSERFVSRWHLLPVPDALSHKGFQATSEHRFSRTTPLLSLSFTKRVSGRQASSWPSSLYVICTCCLSGAPSDKPRFCL